MPRRIVLHAGFHQTGTGRLQDALRANRVALKKHIGLRLPWHLQDVLAPARAYSETQDVAALTQTHTQFAHLLDALPGMPRRSLIISAADLCGQVPGRGTLRNYAAAPALLYGFWDAARQRFPNADIIILLTLRAPENWLSALYAHHLKTSRLDLSFDTFRTQNAALAWLDGMAAEIASRVPAPVRTLTVDDETGRPDDPLRFLLGMCEVPQDLQETLTPVPPTRATPCSATLDALLEINRTHQNPAERRAAKDALLGSTATP